MVKPNDIVKYKNQVGRLLKGMYDKAGKILFYPAEHSSYNEKDLEEVNPEEVVEATLDDKIKYLKKRFVWGKVISVEVINHGEYIFFEYIDKFKKEKEIFFHPYLNFEDLGVSCKTLDYAIISTLDYKYQGVNSQAALMFKRMLEMDTPQKRG